MGVRRPQNIPKRHVRQDEIVHIAAAALQQSWIFKPRYALTDRKLPHSELLR